MAAASARALPGGRAGNVRAKSTASVRVAGPSKLGGKSGAGSGAGRVMLNARISSGSETTRSALR